MFLIIIAGLAFGWVVAFWITVGLFVLMFLVALGDDPLSGSKNPRRKVRR
jgi:hypothetical protein